jgi:hypothetical protein
MVPRQDAQPLWFIVCVKLWRNHVQVRARVAIYAARPRATTITKRTCQTKDNGVNPGTKKNAFDGGAYFTVTLERNANNFDIACDNYSIYKNERSGL